MRELDATPNPPALSRDELGFIEFEHRVFGYANGAAKPHVLRALKSLCEVVPLGGCDYQIVEQSLTAPVAWLVINALRHSDMIEQGPSMRSIRFTDRGVFLAEFVRARCVENLVGLAYDSEKESSGAGYRESGGIVKTAIFSGLQN
jgi:hypothetical protein